MFFHKIIKLAKAQSKTGKKKKKMDLKITSSHLGKKDLVLITETDSNQDRQTTRKDALNMDKWFIIL